MADFAEWIRELHRSDTLDVAADYDVWSDVTELLATLYETTQASFGCCGGYHGNDEALAAAKKFQEKYAGG